MVKEKRILSYFIGWLVLGLIICFVGINKTYAQVINSTFLGQNVNTNFGVSANSYKQGVSSITVDSSSALNYLVVDVCSTISNDFTITNINNQSGNVSLYSVYHNLGTCNTGNYSGELSKIYFTVNSWADAGNGNYGLIFSSRFNNTISYYGDNKILNIYTDNKVDNTSDIINNQTNELNNSINNSTNTITGSITESQNNINSNIQSSQDNITNSITETEDNINSNIDDMEQSIVDSNKETQDVIKDQFNSCRPSKNLFDAYNITFGTPHNSSYIINDSNSITVTNNGGWSRVYATINGLKPNTFYTISADMINNNNIPAGLWINDNNNNLQYNDSRVVVRTTSNGSIDFQFYTNWNSTPNYGQVIYNNIQIEEGSSATTFEKPGEICTNKLDEQNDKLSGIQGALTDSSAPKTSGLENSAGWLPAGPLDSILNLPLTMLNSLTNSLSKTCSPLNLTLPYVNKQLQIPCLSSIFAKITGVNGLWTWVGTIASVLILYNYLLNLYAWVDRVLTLRAEFDEAMGADLANWGRL